MERQYIAATEIYNTCERHVCAPVLRREFYAERTGREEAVIEISAVGFYRLFLNGKEITKGCLAPYISNPDDIVYYDLYEVGDLLCGENVLCILLGNGFSNSLDGGVWDFESASYRCAPKVYAALAVKGERVLSTDSGFEVYDSPITFDDYRCGEFYDARRETPALFSYGYRGNARPALPAPLPAGEYRLCKAHPIRECGVLSPVSVTPSGRGYLYDFGRNDSGVCRLKISSQAGRKISLTHGEVVRDGKLDLKNISFGERSREGYIQHDEYICKEGEQEWQPCFTYHGFRYVYVEGIEPSQATKELLSFVVLHSAIGESGRFECDDDTICKIQECTLRSDLSNFHYFPTDCPQREKNGWTADASLSCEQMLYNFDCADSLREWLHNIRKAQNPQGALPGIVPTGGWGFAWGNGPAWDSVLVELPYQIHRFTGEKEILAENADAIAAYFSYLRTKINGDGLLGFGLGDWCESGSDTEICYTTPVEITDTLTVISLCHKTEQIFFTLARDCAEIVALREELTAAYRKKYVKGGALAVETQTAYAMSIVLGMFEKPEEANAYERLKQLIAAAGEVFRIGVIGQKYLFPLLFERGDAELAFRLVKGPRFPSYGYWVEHGFTTLAESFLEIDEEKYPEELARKDGQEKFTSFNHHFWGSVSALFYEYLAGLSVSSVTKAVIQPKFVSEIGRAKARYGRGERSVRVEWKRAGEEIELTAERRGYELEFRLPEGYACVSKREETKSGAYKISLVLRRV